MYEFYELMLLELEQVEKSFNGQPALRGVSLAVAAGEVVALLGPSGCGKTTLLRVIAGLEKPDGGRLRLEGQELDGVPVHQRGFGFVFQDYALFPHKNVAENVAFGLKMAGWEPARRAARVAEVLALVGLAGFEGRRVFELSGGEQQRVALARALAPSPRLLLLDEPLGSLDRALRERLMGELRAILQEAGRLASQPGGITAIYVTHDQAEAFAVADRVMVMQAGRIEQSGTPVELYRQPRTPFVARFLGMENLLPGEWVSAEPPVVRTALGELQVAGYVEPGEVPPTLLIRPGAGQLLSPGQEATNVVAGRLEEVSFRGRYQVATITLQESDGPVALKLEFESAVSLPPAGSEVRLALNPARLIVLE
ncbi:MAG: ABC transporter ATP-binding protein [Chloroflexi bacterium]|nr:ABC transporter ATP-binding protein [Chloroflexota bacterium]MCI0728145.1 ABC transporter ATP-binding protein [Chloroflexota bacterium]